MTSQNNQSAINRTYDLMVIGGGVLGAFHAYHAVQRGLSVVLLERDAAPRGATVRNFGQVVPSGLDRHWQRFGRESLDIYQSLQARFDLSVRQQGSIYLASDDEEQTLLEELHELDHAADYPSELWTASQCRARYPQLRPDYCRGGLFYPTEVSVNPRVMIHRLLGFLAEQPPFESHFRAGVRELTTSGNGRVIATTQDGRLFTAEKAIVCGGSDFQTLFPDRFRDSELKTVKLQMLRIAPSAQAELPGNILTGRSIRRYESFSQCRSWSAIKAREPRDDFATRWGIHLLFKQEADGGIIVGDSHEYLSVGEATDIDYQLRSDISAFFVNEGRKIFDLPSWEVQTSWFGVYCQTNDPSGIFTDTIDNNIHIVTGIGGKGMTSSAGFSKHHLEEIWHG